VEDQPADTGDLTTAAQPAEAEQPARRWWQRRRRPKVTEPVVTETTETPTESTEPEEAQPAQRKPTGKAGRAAKTVETAASVEDSERVQAAESDAPETPEAPEVPNPEVILVPHRPAGKRLVIAAAAAAAVFVAAAAFAAATVQPYLTDRAQVDIKLDVARTAANAITTLWSYTPENMDSLPDRSAGYLGGDFANEYRKYIDAIVAPNKQAQVTNTTQVMGAAVETLTQSEATAIVYTNSVATSPVTKNIPSLRYLSYRLTMERRDAKWLITKMSTVTSLDLTPRV
jgi:Mce-associated membrane protein